MIYRQEYTVVHGKNSIVGMEVRAVRTCLGSSARQPGRAPSLPQMQVTVVESASKNAQEAEQIGRCGVGTGNLTF